MNEQEKSILLQLREAAMEEAHEDHRYLLRSCADMVEKCIIVLTQQQTYSAMTDLNGAWAYADRVLKLHHEPKAPSPPTTMARRDPKAAYAKEN